MKTARNTSEEGANLPVVKKSARSGQIKRRLPVSQCSSVSKTLIWRKHDILCNYITFEIQKLKVYLLAVSWVVFDSEYDDHIVRDMASTRVTSIIPQFY